MNSSLNKHYPIGEKVRITMPGHDNSSGQIVGESRDRKLWWIREDGKVTPRAFSKHFCTVITDYIPPSRQLVWRPRTITIMVDEHGFNVVEGDRRVTHLCWDEMIGHVAAMTIPKTRVRPDGLYPMKTQSEEAEYERHWEIAASRRRLLEEGYLTKSPFDIL